MSKIDIGAVFWYTDIDLERVVIIANKTVYTEEHIELQDGTPLVLKPLPIKRQRKFMKEMQASSDRADANIKAKEEAKKANSKAVSSEESEDDQDDQYDDLLRLVDICLEKDYSELVADRERLEDILDEVTAYRIIEVCGGIKLNDPNLLRQVLEMQAQQEAGTA